MKVNIAIPCTEYQSLYKHIYMLTESNSCIIKGLKIVLKNYLIF